jgi:hypothetical protein
MIDHDLDLGSLSLHCNPPAGLIALPRGFEGLLFEVVLVVFGLDQTLRSSFRAFRHDHESRHVGFWVSP